MPLPSILFVKFFGCTCAHPLSFTGPAPAEDNLGKIIKLWLRVEFMLCGLRVSLVYTLQLVHDAAGA